MNNIGRELAEFCVKNGSDIHLAQGAGGNVSYKESGFMWIKASGTWLSDATRENIFSCINLNDFISDFSNDVRVNPVNYTVDEAQLRPSIETSMHALINKQYVAHFHSINVLSYAVLENGQSLLEELLHGFSWRWVPYVKPGVDLALAVQAVMEPDVSIYFLANHGIIVAADSLVELGNMLHKVHVACLKEARPLSSHAAPVMLESSCSGWQLLDDPHIQRLAFDNESRALLQAGYFYPDQVIFLPVDHILFEGIEAIKEAGVPFGICPGLGVYAQSNLSKALYQQLVGHALLLERLSMKDSYHVLNKSEVNALLNWDAEKYRQSLQR